MIQPKRKQLGLFPEARQKRFHAVRPNR